MKVIELRRKQLVELKQAYLIRRLEENGEMLTCSDLANADEIIPDKVVFRLFADVEFPDDDFFCRAG